MTLLEKLRAGTRSAHERIEQAMDLDHRMTSPEAYRAVLERFYGFHAAWEDRASAAFADPEFFDPRRKTGLLLQDLRALGLSPEAIAALPAFPPLVPTANRSDVLGTMYVMEGSTLGGTIIARLVVERFGYEATTGCAYFRSYGSGVGSMWRQFRARLEAEDVPDADAVVASAVLTFHHLQGWVCGKLPESAAA
ncbi:MAG: biliverdin-producing heme oxygenase [Microvirga sp.]